MKQLYKLEFGGGLVAAGVYIAAVEAVSVEPVWPEGRQAQLDATVDAAHRRARYTVWRLLEYALWDALGLRLRELQLTLKEGKWSCPECFFSLSHSGEAVAVAVSETPIGVDLEPVRPLKAGLENKILSSSELAHFGLLEAESRGGYLLQQWCKKESMFKCSRLPAYAPKTLIPGENSRCLPVTLEGQAYCLAVTCQVPSEVQLQIVEELR